MVKSTKMKDVKGTTKSSGKENEPILENGKKKTKEERPATKVVVRRLPPTMTAEQFKLQVSPLAEIDYFYFVPADMSLIPNAFSRAYINFVDQSDLFIFTQKFDGYVFVDSKGGEFPAVVEFAPFQRIPKNRPNRKKDPKVGTIESDPIYIKFKEHLEALTLENKTSASVSKQHFFETTLEPEKKEANNTPLLDFIKNKRAERQRIRDEKREEKRKRDLERKRVKEEQRRIRKEDDTSVLKQIPPSSDCPLPVTPDVPKTQESCSNNTIIKSIKDKEHTLNSADVNNGHGDENVSKQVLDLMSHFDKAVNNSSVSDQNNESSESQVKHRDIEAEMIKNSLHLKKGSIEDKNYPNNNNKKNLYTHNSFTPKKSQVNKIQSGNKQTSFQGSWSRVFIPQTSRSDQYIVAKDNICEGSQVMCHRSSKTVENAKSTNSETAFPSEAFRKNLKKVVVEVLGNSTVKTSNQCAVNKPKIFMRRVDIGSGEQCVKPGFNSPNFYLPPRTFGCGLTKHTNPGPAESSRPSKSFIRSVPPFSKTYMSISKSDEVVKESKNCDEVVGYDESLRRNMRPLSRFVINRPRVTPKMPVIMENK